MASSRVRRRIKSPTAALSMGGSVLGMQQSEVKPPRAPALVPVAIVSLYSKPGSRRWQWMSIKPGLTTSPAASIVGQPSGITSAVTSPTTEIRPSLTRMLDTWSIFRPGSTTRPFLISNRSELMLLGPGAELEEQRHANGYTVGYLFFDDRVAAVGDAGADFYTLIHRPRVHHQSARFSLG